jgi:hypothetical protein
LRPNNLAYRLALAGVVFKKYSTARKPKILLWRLQDSTSYFCDLLAGMYSRAPNRVAHVKGAPA